MKKAAHNVVGRALPRQQAPASNKHAPDDGVYLDVVAIHLSPVTAYHAIRPSGHPAIRPSRRRPLVDERDTAAARMRVSSINLARSPPACTRMPQSNGVFRHSPPPHVRVHLGTLPHRANERRHVSRPWFARACNSNEWAVLVTISVASARRSLITITCVCAVWRCKCRAVKHSPPLVPHIAGGVRRSVCQCPGGGGQLESS